MNINEAAWIPSSWMLNIKFQIAIFQKPLKIIWCGFRQSPPYWSALKYLVELKPSYLPFKHAHKYSFILQFNVIFITFYLFTYLFLNMHIYVYSFSNLMTLSLKYRHQDGFKGQQNIIFYLLLFYFSTYLFLNMHIYIYSFSN